MKHCIAIALTAALVLTGYRHDPQQIVPVEFPEPPVEILTNYFNFIRLPRKMVSTTISNARRKEPRLSVFGTMITAHSLPSCVTEVPTM